MGCCISKCKPKKSSKYKEESMQVQDKLVISQASSPPPPPPITLPINKKAFVSSLSPTSLSTTTSLSSFSCTCSHGSTISCSSSLSTASSTLTSSKDKSSFSNEFLWSCVKENPHIICVDPVTESPAKPVRTKIHAQKLYSPPAKQSNPQRAVRPKPPQKRARPNSPTLTRQKSFRREHAERSVMTYSLPNRTLMRSPSPSRRFNGENFNNVVPNTPKESHSKRAVGSRTNAVQSIASRGHENARPASPSSNSTSSRHWRSLHDRETLNNRIGSKIDKNAVGEVVSNMEIDTLPMEDMNNPHISLDCFIFL